MNKNFKFLIFFILTSSLIFSKDIKNVVAFTEIFGDGQKLTTVGIEYNKSIDNKSLNNDTFQVEGRTVKKIYTNTSLTKTDKAKNGKFVIIELSLDDKNSYTFSQFGGEILRTSANVELKQMKDIKTTSKKILKANSEVIKNNEIKNLIVDDFMSFEYHDLKTGKTLKYNLYIPKNYDSLKKYPLVFFGHDAGVTGNVATDTLVQGLGATSFASPEEQAKHECFVLAPQYGEQFISDDKTTDYLDITIDLINFIQNKYTIDSKRIYATGQSGGCMLTINMSIKYPNLFAALYLVAGQWDAKQMADKLFNKNIWIVVSEGDAKAFPGMNEATETMKLNGSKITKDIWSGNISKEEINKKYQEMVSIDSNIKYIVLQKGTVVPLGQPDIPPTNHVNTWRIAYTFTPILDWLFSKSNI